MDGSFASTKDSVTPALIDVTRTAGKIAAEDVAFQRSINPAVGTKLDNQNARLLRIVNRLTKNSITDSQVQWPNLTDVDSVEEQWQGLVDVFDSILEKADACLDEYSGVIRKSAAPGYASLVGNEPLSRKLSQARGHRTQALAKPQLRFERPPANNGEAPFKPLLRSKPHAVKPLDESLSPQSINETRIEYGHPYETEIKAFQYPTSVYENTAPIPFIPLDVMEAIFVDTMDGVKNMLQELKMAKEIAVDLEHHDTHSYIGLTSLMQISTRGKDWIVDTLLPWREELQILNEVFADPGILKIFHGSHMDMIWLQRDLGLYVVGLFDTFYASKALGYPKKSLASLLLRHANFNAAKQYQMADWRIRPLPKEMFDYARSDTHFLLYVYDNLRNELLEKSDKAQPDGDLIDYVLRESKEVALQRYERPLYDARQGLGSNGWFGLLNYSSALLDREQFAVFRAVHQWRDSIARKEDENVNTVMPKYVIFNIAREMPESTPKLLGCSHPISPWVRERLAELLEIVRQAKVEGAAGPDMKEAMQAIDPERFRLNTTDLPEPQTAITVARPHLPPALLSDVNVPSRALNSVFWGPTVDLRPSQPIRAESISPSHEVRLVVPMPQLTAEVYADCNDNINKNSRDLDQTDNTAAAEHALQGDGSSIEDDVFVIGGPKKRKAALMDEQSKPWPPHGGHEIASVNTDLGSNDMKMNGVEQQAMDDQAMGKTERKLQKKLEKQRRKQEEQKRYNGIPSSNGLNGDEPFDYETAPSVLHAKVSESELSQSIRGVNPYSKSLDAPKGMGRARKETTGKSFTFKS